MVEQNFPWIRAALSGYALIEASSFERAETAILEESIDLFLLEVHFDDSRATELVNIIRRNTQHLCTPIIIVRLAPSELLGPIRQTMISLIALSRINDYIEFRSDKLSDEYIANCIARYLV